MSIPNKQIGWSNESNLLWQVAKQLDRLTKIVASVSTQVTVDNTDTNPVPVSTVGEVSVKVLGKSTGYKLISTASTNANLVYGDTTLVPVISAIGLTSDVRYLKIYNTNTIPDVGTDIPILTIPVPANTQGAGVVIPFSPIPLYLENGLAIAITANASDSDNTPVGAGDVIVNLNYSSY